MNRQFIQVTHGLLPFTVLVLLAAALIAGQFHADSRDVVTHSGASATGANSLEIMRSTDSVPDVVDTFLTLPSDIDLTINLRGQPSKSDVNAKRLALP